MSFTQTFRGKAQVSGSAMTFDVILYPIPQSAKMDHEFKLDIVEDSNGDDISLRAHNEMYSGDIGMVLVDQSSTSSLANAESGGAFLSPLSTVTISACQLATWNGTWQYRPSSSIDLQNTQPGKMSYKLVRYANSTQQTLLTSTPS